MLGAGDRRFVLLDFLLIDLPGVPRGSSATRGYGVGGGVTVCPRGRKRGIHPNPLAAIASLRLPHGKFRKVQTAAS